MNLYELFKDTASRYPEKTAVVEGNRSVSYRDLDAVISVLAKDLEKLGAAPGQMIGLCFANSIAYIALTYALWKIDAAVVPVDVDFTEDEIRQVCDRMQLAAMISHKGESGWVEARCPFIDTPYYFRSMDVYSGLESDIHIAFVRFTSGTTGERKGVVLSHERIAERISAVNRALNITPDDNILWILPMSHHFVSTIVLFLASGAALVLAGGIWSKSILKTVNSGHVTLLYASPFHYSLLAADQSGLMMPEVRLAISTAIGLPGHIHERFSGRFGLPLAQAYGIIEIGVVCINTENPGGKPGSVGRVLPDYRVSVENAQAYSGPEGMECGELFFSGPGFFDGYFYPRIDEKSALINGWFETGDIGGRDKEGFLFLYGRKNHVINTAGMKIFPQEIEAHLNRHPSVKESCVYGRKHDRFGQTVAAMVVLNSTAEETDEETLRRFCSRSFTAYKVPSQIFFTDHIEKTATGKIIRPGEQEG
ncbi:MAG: acyl--CoA ligase [Desulfobacterales bacterium]|nr:acyl--CoA ligase [Desulfobacterales bacterium]